MANTNYIQLVQVIVLLFIGPLWPLSTFDTRRRGLVWWSWFFRYSGRRGRYWQHEHYSLYITATFDKLKHHTVKLCISNCCISRRCKFMSWTNEIIYNKREETWQHDFHSTRISIHIQHDYKNNENFKVDCKIYGRRLIMDIIINW